MTPTLRSTALFTIISALFLYVVGTVAEAEQKRVDTINQEQIAWTK